MSCGGRVYKGDSVTISVPFDVEGYTNLTITYSTTGSAVIEKTEKEVTIEDGFITYTFDGHELDILPDGVIYYTISYQIDGVEHVESTNTPIYLATPAGYSGLTADEIYQSGYTAGLNDCSGDTPCDCTSAVTQAYQSGYTAGYESGYEDGEEDCPSLQYQKNVTIGVVSGTVIPDSNYDAMKKVAFNAQLVYNNGYQSGYTAGLNDCSGGSSCEVGYTWYDLMDGEFNGEVTLTLPDFNLPVGQIGVSSITIADKDYGEGKYNSGYNSGFTDGYASAITASSGSCLIQAQKTYSLDPDGDGTWTAHPDGGYDGVAEIVIKDNVGYGQSLYTSGYAAGLAACSGGCNLIADTNSLNGAWGGRTTYYPPAGYDGFSEITIYDNGYGNSRYNDGRTAGFSSGYTSGYTDGHSSGYTEGYNAAITANCGTAITEAYESGYTEGYNAADTKIYSSSKDIYFDELAWVDVEDSAAYSEGDTIMIDYKWGNTVTGLNPIVLFSNESYDPAAVNPPLPTTPSFSIVMHTAGPNITTDDGQGNRQLWVGLNRGAQLNHSYRLIVQTYSYTHNVTIKAALIDLTSGEITTGSTNGALHFTGATSLSYCINGWRNTVDGAYQGMNTDWYLGGIKIFDSTGRMKHNYHFLNGCIADIVNDLETGYEAKYYDNLVETDYQLTGVEETMRFFY